LTCDTASGSSVIAGAVIVPMLTEPKRPAFSASISSCAWLRLANHGFPVPRWAHATRKAVEQLHLEHVLEILQQLRGGRLRHVQHLRGAVDVAFFLHRHEEKQLASLQAGADEPVGVGGGHVPGGREWSMDGCPNVYGKTPKIY